MCVSNTLEPRCTRSNTRRALSVLFLVVGGLVVKAPASRAEDPGFGSRLRFWDFPGSCHTSDFKKNGTSVVSLQGARSDRVSAGTGWPGVSIL